jgi:23S rRNA (cytidine1920-2'-O)/16S rRNA (cytidine1409-2'-O)-methyltransferase
MKKRIDLLLVERGLAATRERAQGLILAGQVLVSDVPVTKPGQSVSEEAAIRIRGDDHPYVSRGGIKLAAALEAFHISASGRSALDIGASTGGFTHVLLLNGAVKVFAVDVGHSQLDWLIRKDPRVVVHEKVNARNLEFALIGQKVDLIVVDVSFISLDKIFPAAMQFAHSETDWVTLIKPQFEVGKEKVGKGGIVTSEDDRQEVIRRLVAFAESLGLAHLGLIESPITGTQGNKEFLAHWKRTQSVL